MDLPHGPARHLHRKFCDHFALHHCWPHFRSVDNIYILQCKLLLGPFHGAIVVLSVTRCRWRRGHRCAGGARQYRWRHLVNGREAARSSEWAQHFFKCFLFKLFTVLDRYTHQSRYRINSTGAVSSQHPQANVVRM